MKAQNQKEKASNPKLGFFKMLAAMFSLRGIDSGIASRRAFHHAFADGGNPEYTPRKHTVMSYAKQNRIAKKRRARKPIKH